MVVRIGMTLREVEQLVIAATLEQTHGNISKCARILGIDRATVYSKIRRKEDSCQEPQEPRPDFDVH